MKINSITLAWSIILRLIVKLISILTGKSGGRLAQLLPSNQEYLVKNYCGIYRFNVNTTYPMESMIWLSGM